MSHSFSLLHSGPFAPAQVRLHLTPALRAYSPEVQRLIESAWADAGPHLWDGPVYSLLGSRVVDGALHCDVQQTTYKAFYGANVRHCADVPDKAGLPNSLACCCICQTADDYILAGLRSSTVAEDQLIWHIPGGNLDDLSSGDAAPFAQIRREVEEEAHVSGEHIAALTCLGMGRSLRTWKPEFLFHAQLTLTGDELRARLAHAEDASEHTRWELVPAPDMARFAAERPFSLIGLAAITLWRRLLRGEAV